MKHGFAFRVQAKSVWICELASIMENHETSHLSGQQVGAYQTLFSERNLDGGSAC